VALVPQATQVGNRLQHDFMNYRDAELLNGSIDKLGDSLLRNRMLEEQKLERGDAKNFREQQLGIEQQRVDGQTKLREQMLQSEQGKKAIADLHGAYEQISKDYQAGVIDKTEANRRAKSIVDHLKMGTDVVLKASPFAQMLESDGDLFSDKLGKPAPSLTPGKIGNRDVMIGPGGSVHYVDEFSPADKLEIEDANRNLSAIESRARELAKNPDPAEARALVMQRTRLESKKNGILSRYKNEDAPAKPSTAAAAPQKADLSATRAEAQAAIKAGKDPAAVRKRFKDMTGEDL
jgi:hypothetical protein